MHGGNAKSHEDAAENEGKRRCALATNYVKAAAGYEDRHQERKGGQPDVVGHRYRHDEGEHADEVHRPNSASHCDRSRYQPDATRKSLGGPHVPAETEGGVRREAGDQNGQSDEIRIICSGNDHRDRPQFSDQRPSRTNPSAHLQVQPATSLGRIKGRYSPHDLVREHQDAPSALSSQGRLARSGTALRFWCQGGLPSSLFVTSSPWRARAATTDSGMPFTSGQILRSEEVRAFVDFLTEKFAPDSFKGMRSASSSGRRRAKQVAVVVCTVPSLQ